MWNGINKRKFPRAIYKCLITVRVKETPVSIITCTENISEGGICVTIKERLELFTILNLVLTLNDGLPPVKCKGKVVWTIKRAELKKEKPQQYDTGIEFVDLLPEDRKRIAKIVEDLVKDQS